LLSINFEKAITMLLLIAKTIRHSEYIPIYLFINKYYLYQKLPAALGHSCRVLLLRVNEGVVREMMGLITLWHGYQEILTVTSVNY
jgi:hypothetical protein